MIAPYIAIAATGLPAAARSGGVLRWYVWAGGYADVWPGSWLQAEIHAVAFCCLMFGLTLGASLVKESLTTRTCNERLQVAVLAALFIGTAAAYYPAPWAMWIRPYLVYWQSACYLALAAP